ncbi:hypothetical protein CFC21_022107 [Triticum aestivum]|uniref:KIB1-4 beta-propeller domain-containing protein n=2 Tax=Triticum aestivum TaxID=4565 RepID=A0A3B6C1B5_WHEAT|nr:uncharacterized protein LOC123043907 [Triticum aestivum]KAF7007146.1 hypothetical protein CFC21_022107 [Triticum aestivum]
MASNSTPSSTPASKVPKSHRRRRTKRARVGDGSSAAAESTVHAPASEWRDWASLGSGPAWLIADRVLSRDVADYVRFRASSKAWRRCTADPQADALDPRFHPRCWTMLQDVVSRGLRYRYSRFKNDATGEHIRMTIRGLNGRDGRTHLARTSQGLLVLLNKKTDAVFVVNPVTGARADLPPVTALLSGFWRADVFPRWPHEVHFGVELTYDSAIVINLHGLLGVARPGDERWAEVEWEDPILGPVLSFAGRVYCFVDDAAMVLETSPDHPPRLSKADHNPFGSVP